MKKILIIGGGFAGATVAFKLSQKLDLNNFEICLVSKNSDFNFYPSIFHTLSGYTPSSMSWPLKTMLSGCKINILQDEVLNVNLESKTANLKVSGQSNFDYVVFATGSEVVYFNMQEYKNLFYTIDNRQNILKLRQRLITEIANCNAVNVNVIGAGPTGSETAGELAFAAADIAKSLNLKNPVNLKLFAAGSRITEQFTPKTSQLITEKLQKMGVNVIYNSHLTPDQLKAQNSECEINVWCAGFKACKIDKIVNAKFSANCKLEVNEFLQVKNLLGNAFEYAYAAGDVADTPLSGLAQTAQRHAGAIAANILRQCTDQRPLPSRDITLGYVLTMGPKWGVYTRGNITVGGGFMAVFKRLIDFKSYVHMMPLKTALKVFLSFKYEGVKK